MKWNRHTTRYGSLYGIKNKAGEFVLRVGKMEYCGRWFVYVGEDQDEADGTAFNTLWEAKQYAERQVEKGRVSL